MVLELILAFGLGAVGSFFMWLFVGSRIVGRQIIEKGGEAALSWMDEAIPDDPKAPPHPAVQKLVSYMTAQVAQTLYGAFGNIEQKVKKQLQNLDVEDLMKNGIPGGSLEGVLGAITGGDSKNPMSGLASIFSMFQMFQNMERHVGGNVGGFNPGISVRR
jgi:hypothetical protein